MWGENFGPVRGSNYITINGAKLTSKSDYAEWGVTKNNARGLERITFWLNDKAANGAGKITVTVGGLTSNTLPFTVRSGYIYFISVNNGNDSYDGTKAANQGNSHGPWKSPSMALHSNNGIILSGDTIYVRAGTYTANNVVMDNDATFMRGRGDYGTVGRPLAIVGYPGEMPIFDLSSGAGRGVFSMELGTYTGLYGGQDLGHGADYIVLSKLKAINGAEAIVMWGVGDRVIGSYFKDNNLPTWSGVVMINTAEDAHVYGNYFEHNGYDAYKHNIYIKTHDGWAIGTMTEAKNIYVGWNEFDSWTTSLNPTEAPRGGCIEIQTESTAANNNKHTNRVFIHDNYFHDGDSEPLYITDVSYLKVYNNIFANTGSPRGSNGIFLAMPNDNSSSIFNNVFYHVGNPTHPMFFMVSKSSSPSFKNNIFYVYSGQSYAKVEYGSEFNSDHDLYYGNGAPPSGTGVTVINTITEEPRFVDIADHDFQLQGNSPAINAGTSDVSSVVKRDYDGISRPQPVGGAYDIGAYEYQK